MAQSTQPAPTKQIFVKISSVKESGYGTWLYTHYITFPTNTSWKYDIRASLEGFAHTTKLWKEAGYEIVYENDYPE